MPPADLSVRGPELVIVPAGAALHRFHTVPYDPIYFDASTSGRLNAPDGSYGVLYAAKDIRGAFAETFLRTPGLRLIDTGRLKAKAYAHLSSRRELRLVKLTGPGLGRLGATAEVTHGSLPYDMPQAWSKALHAHPIQADGIAYTARHDDEQLCYAIFDRCRAEIVDVRRVTDLDQDWFWEVAEVYDVGLAPDF